MTMSSTVTGQGRASALVRGRGIDGVTVLTVYLVLLCAVPSNLSITALGSAGRPSGLWALAATLWWCWHQIQRHAPSRVAPQYVRIGLFVFLGCAGITYSWAMLRGLPYDEISPADNGMLRLVAWGGILLVANDGIESINGFRTLMRRIALAGGLLGTLGLLQFATGASLIDWISIPGMSADFGVSGLDSRGGFTRASATASHPLEYGLVLCIAFPIALTLAIDDIARSPLARWFPVAAIGVASIMSVSRSALVGLIAGVIILVPTWSRRFRLVFGVVGAALIVAVGVLVPGLIGTIRGMFMGISDDPSALSRTSSYDSAAELLSRFPLVGKGFGTLLPRYHIFDNQYLLIVIELGVLGFVAFLALLGAAIYCARAARRAATVPLDKQLCQSLIAATVAGGVLLAFFDGFSFPMAAGMIFLTIGACGAARRLFTARPPHTYRSAIR